MENLLEKRSSRSAMENLLEKRSSKSAMEGLLEKRSSDGTRDAGVARMNAESEGPARRRP